MAVAAARKKRHGKFAESGVNNESPHPDHPTEEGATGTIPRFVAGRAAVLLRAEDLDDARTRNWIDPRGQTREIGPAVMLVQMNTPNRSILTRSWPQ